MRIVIAGAGIAGLATALRLTRDGHRVLIVERAAARRTGGYLVNLLGSGFDAAVALGLEPALRDLDQGLFTSNLIRADGTVKLTMPAAMAETSLGDRALTLFRGDLEAALHTALGGAAEIRFGTVITAVTQPDGGSLLRITLGDGTAVEADLLIGADGVHSGVRELVFGPELEFVRDLGHAVAAFPLSAAPAGLPAGTANTFIDVGRTAAVFHPRGRAPSAFFTYRTTGTAASDPAAGGAAAQVAARFGDVAGVPELLADPAAADAYFDVVCQVVMPEWSRGRMVLLGDAAWCVSLFAGHGAGLALAGADRLGDALRAHPGDPEHALRVWEEGLRAEVRTRQRQARAGMARFAPPSRAHIAVQDLLLRALTAPLIGPALLSVLGGTAR